jgi:UDP-glucose 4-epimerase
MGATIKKILVTGGAGFIGSNLVDALISGGFEVRIADNFSTGFHEFVEQHKDSDAFEIIKTDLIDEQACGEALAGCDAIYHLAANADVRFGWQQPLRDTQQNLVVTQNLLEVCRKQGVRKFVFSSTGSVYGKAKQIPTPEDCSFPTQTSLYAASKLAAEGLINAYAEADVVDATIFRFVSILGRRYTHGHVFDFVKQLLDDPKHLKVLGDGNQTKSYLHVDDCTSALVRVLNGKSKLDIFNLGTNETVTVNQSIDIICRSLNCEPLIEYTGGTEGWIGDNPHIFLDTTAARATGWSSVRTISESIRETVDWLVANNWVLQLRDR